MVDNSMSHSTFWIQNSLIEMLQRARGSQIGNIPKFNVLKLLNGTKWHYICKGICRERNWETYLTIKQLRVSVLNKTRWYWNIFCLGCESVHEDGDCFCHNWRSVCNVNVRCQLSAMRRVETVAGMMHLYHCHCGKSTVSSPPPHLNHPPWAASNNTLVSGLN